MRYVWLLMLAGCASQWAHPDRTNQQFSQDALDCERIAYATVFEIGLAGDILRNDLGKTCLRSRGWLEVTP